MAETPSLRCVARRLITYRLYGVDGQRYCATAAAAADDDSDAQ